MIPAESLQAELKQLGIRLWAEQGQLKYDAPKGAFTDTLKKRVQALRTELLALLERETESVLPSWAPLLVEHDANNRYEPFPLTDVQHAYWIGRQDAYEFGNIATHAYSEIDFIDLDVERLEKAWQRLIDRHDMLRMVVDADGRQRILRSVPLYRIATTDLSRDDLASVQSRLDVVRREMSHQVLATDCWPLFDIRVTRLGGSRLRIHLSLDLLLVDFSSADRLLTEWVQMYREPEAALPELAITFRDYVLAERAFQQGDAYRAAERYWMERLDSLPSAAELPLCAVRDRAAKSTFRRHAARLPAAQWQQLRSSAGRAGLSPTEVLLAAFSHVLATWSKGPRFTLNLTLFNRFPLHPDVPRLIGDFTALTLLEVDADPGQTAVGLGRRIQAQLWRDLDHQAFNGVRVLRALHSRRGGVLMPIVFTSTLGMGSPRSETGFGEFVYGISQTPQVWLDHQVSELEGGLAYSWDAVDDLFPSGLIGEMFDAYGALLARLAADDGAWERPLPVLTPEAQLAQRARVNATVAPLPPVLLHELVADQARRLPTAPAVLGPDTSLSYGELLGRATAVAARLRAEGIRPGELAAVVLDKGCAQVVAVLGVQMAGAAYLPVDPDLPDERRALLLREGCVRLALTSTELAGRLPWPDALRTLAIDTLAAQDPATLAPAAVTPDDLAYVIYTSGSTGTPKGVAIDHRGAVNTVLDINRRFAITAADRVFGLSALNFDLSVWDIFGLLAAGGALVLPAAGDRLDPAHWLRLMRSHRVSVWNSVPALMQMLADTPGAAHGTEALRLVMMSGDRIPVSLPDRLRTLWPQAALYSLGGATEASIWSIVHPITPADSGLPSIPYGKPLDNQSFHVLDGALQPRPVWVPGELYIGGIGLAKGYWNDPEKTAASFIHHPGTGERLYRTGDWGRWLADGSIEFLGREDTQVKIRGHRIELGEIEATLMQHPAIRAAAAVVVEHQGSRQIAAYVVAPFDDPGLAVREDADPCLAERRWSAVLEGAARQAAAVPADIDRIALDRFFARLEEASLCAMCRALHSLGCFIRPGERYDAVALAADGCVQPRYAKLLGQWLEALARSGLLQRDGEGYVAAEPLPEPPASALALDHVVGDAPWQRVLLDYFHRCTAHHMDLLTGRIGALELFFPDGRWDTAETLYEVNPLSGYYNAIVAAALAAAARVADRDRPFRVLEVGAGTGGTTSSLLPLLPPGTEYLFTDVSSFFTAQAGRKFSDYPFVSYGFYDIDRDPQSQGYAMHGFDAVVAANVLHDAVSIIDTLGRLRTMLRPGGLLLALEGTRDSFLQMVTVRFIEGFSQYQDDRVARNSPLLPAEDWLAAMHKANFAGSSAFPPEPGHGTYILAARTPTSVWRFAPEKVRAFLTARLPEYMVPATVTRLDALPQTANGKLDRKALAGLAPAPVECVAEPPATDSEARVHAIWRTVLGRDEIGVTDNFFEIGGDSLLVMRILTRLRQDFTLSVPLRDLFDNVTIRRQAARLDTRLAAQALPAMPPPDSTATEIEQW